jgi:2'-5' RNA ligase
MRTFIAIPLSNECQSILTRMQQSLRVHKSEVRWTSIPSIHLTLKFLGEADPGVIPELDSLLQLETQNERSFDLKLCGLGCFPNTKSPRVVWCGIEGETDSLSRLQHLVESACGRLGFVPEDRAFQPHLTLGRVKGRKNLQPLMGQIAAGSELSCGFRVDRFHIYKSTLNPQGAEYTVLSTVVLNDY